MKSIEIKINSSSLDPAKDYSEDDIVDFIEGDCFFEVKGELNYKEVYAVVALIKSWEK